MSLIRFNIQGAVPLPLTPAQQAFIDDLKARLRILKSHCVNINAGTDNEEDTTSFKYHICRHDEGKPCEPSQEI